MSVTRRATAFVCTLLMAKITKGPFFCKFLDYWSPYENGEGFWALEASPRKPVSLNRSEVDPTNSHLGPRGEVIYVRKSRGYTLGIPDSGLARHMHHYRHLLEVFHV